MIRPSIEIKTLFKTLLKTVRFDLAKARVASTVLIYCFDSTLFDLICGNEFDDCFDFDLI